jgi:hypothetical protein
MIKTKERLITDYYLTLLWLLLDHATVEFKSHISQIQSKICIFFLVKKQAPINVTSESAACDVIVLKNRGLLCSSPCDAFGFALKVIYQ